jgi:hypothetical protein
MFGMSINSLYGQSKEEVYVILYPAKFPGNCPLSFLIIDNKSVKTVIYNIDFSLRKKNKIMGIQKRIPPCV